VQGDGVETAVFGERASWTQTISASLHPMRNLTVKGMETAARMARKMRSISGDRAADRSLRCN